MFDLIGLLSDVTFIVLFAFAMYFGRRSADLLGVERAIRFYMWAAFAQFISAASDLMEIDEDGWPPLVVSAISLTCAVVLIHLTVKRADRMEGVQ